VVPNRGAAKLLKLTSFHKYNATRGATNQRGLGNTAIDEQIRHLKHGSR